MATSDPAPDTIAPDPALPPPPPTPLEERDLGFGAVVAGEHGRRLLNADGTFNVARRGLGFWTSLSIYHALLRTTWPRFLATLALAFLATNALFALAYLACGARALDGPDLAEGGRFLRAFFFSVQTLATIGYGRVVPRGLAANLVMVAESMAGVLGLALATGLLFARFSRPTARVLFSRRAVIAPYRGGRAFMLRIVNGRRSELIEVEAKIVLSLFQDVAGRRTRRFHTLTLERHRVAFFPLAWTIVHPIVRDSPLLGMTQADLLAAEAEFLVLLTGIEETFSQTVHARTSYAAQEVVWGARFADLFNRELDDGGLTIDASRLHDVEPAVLPG